MVAEDRQEKERIDARNALEEYVYDLRSKITEDDQLATFMLEVDREQLYRQLDDTENWLYEEGEECQRQVYSDRLARLRVSYFFVLLRGDVLGGRWDYYMGFSHTYFIITTTIKEHIYLISCTILFVLLLNKYHHPPWYNVWKKFCLTFPKLEKDYRMLAQFLYLKLNYLPY